METAVLTFKLQTDSTKVIVRSELVAARYHDSYGINNAVCAFTVR